MTENTVGIAADSSPEKPKFWQSTWAFVIAFVAIGPFALPLIWKNPRYGRNTKIFVTILALALTAALLVGTAEVFRQLSELARQLEALRQ